MSVYDNEVFELSEKETCYCYYCMRERIFAEYKHGEAYLAGPGHSPCDGNANYICKEHLDGDAVIYGTHR